MKLYIKDTQLLYNSYLLPLLSPKSQLYNLWIWKKQIEYNKYLVLHGLEYFYKNNIISDKLIWQLGYSHMIYFKTPSKIQFKILKPKKFKVSSTDKNMLGLFTKKLCLFAKKDVYHSKGFNPKVSKTIIKKTP